MILRRITINYQSIYLSMYQSINPAVFLSIEAFCLLKLSVYWSLCLINNLSMSVCISVYWSLCLINNLSVSVCISVYQFIWLLTHLSFCLSKSLNTYVYISWSCFIRKKDESKILKLDANDLCLSVCLSVIYLCYMYHLSINLLLNLVLKFLLDGGDLLKVALQVFYLWGLEQGGSSQLGSRVKQVLSSNPRLIDSWRDIDRVMWQWTFR